MEEELNYFQIIFRAAWDLMSTEFTIYGFTITFSGIFCFILLSSFAMRALYILWFD